MRGVLSGELLRESEHHHFMMLFSSFCALANAILPVVETCFQAPSSVILSLALFDRTVTVLVAALF